MNKIDFQTVMVKKKYPFYFKIANHFRNKRFNRFKNIFELTGKEKILDVGGTYHFWESLKEFKNITILNLIEEKSDNRIKSIKYDGTVFPFEDQEFDLVFSNSTIEHVGDFWAKQKFADEIQRVSKKYFIQSPSFWFPYEPHAMIPFFQFMPGNIKMILHNFIKKSSYPIEELLAIKLLTKRELKYLFPEAKIIVERMFFLPKSYYVYSKRPNK